MKEIAVLAIARYGDMIQTTPLLRSLKRAWPDSRITLIVEDRFAGILSMIRGYDRTIILNKREIAWKIATGDNPLAPYLQMESFVRLLEEGSYDLLINITCTRLSAFLSSVTDSREYTGITADERGQRDIRTMWGLYVFSWFNDNVRKYNPINLVDIFTRLGKVMPDGKRVELFPTDEGEQFAEEFLAKHGLAGERLVGLQLGASEAIRCWPAENFARISDRLQREMGVRTILFGAPNEKHLAEKATSFMEIPPIDAVGETSLEGLLSLVRRCSTVVSNDTGTMHFAAASGVPAVMLCIGPAFFRCTGPYGEGHLALQPDIPCSPCPYGLDCFKPDCRLGITPEAVFSACNHILAGGEGLTSADFKGVKVYRSGFADDGYLTWAGLFNVDAATEDILKRSEGMWKRCCDGTGAGAAAPNDEVLREFHRLMTDGIKVTSQIIETARRKPLPLEKVKKLGEAEAALEVELKLMGYRHEILSQVASFLTLMRENITVEDLGAVAAETRRIYETGKCLVANLR